MFTALILDEESSAKLRARFAKEMAGGKAFCHHVTLAMGERLELVTGEPVSVRATHFGKVAGRVCAVKVDGITRKDEKAPHVTLATFWSAKPKESNAIEEWKELGAPIELTGTVQICN